MSGVVAQCHHIFGLRAGVVNSLSYSDEQTVIFPSGNNCVCYNTVSKSQRFIPALESSQGMYALAVSPNYRYLAVSERGEKATITLFDLQHEEQLRKRKVLTGGDIPVQEFVSVAFSADAKYLVGQSGSPDWTLLFWMWTKQRLMAVVKTTVDSNPVRQVSFNPYDDTQVCVTGQGVFKLFRLTEGSLKHSSHHKLEPHNFLCHAWLSKDRVIAGTDTGKLMVFEGGDLRWHMNVASEPASSDILGPADDERAAVPQLPWVTVIAVFSKGFACSAGPGTVFLFDKTDDKDNYTKTREIKIPPDERSWKPSLADQQQFTSLVVSPTEETLVASTDRGQLYSFTLSSAEMTTGEQPHFEFLSHSFHSGPITGLSICIRKPLIATCSLDQSVRIWNFNTNTLELCKEFPAEAFSVSLHPSGLYVLVGFSDKLRLMNLLIDDIRTFKEFTVRSCRECSFSHGGHLFAAVNGNVIHLYSTATFDNVLNLKGHNGKVRSVAWTADDSRLVSCGVEGAVYQWNTLTGQRESECVLKSCSYNGLAISSNSKTIFAVGTDCTVKEIQDCEILREIPAEGEAYTCIAMTRAGSTLFVGTSTGSIRAIKYPPSVSSRDWVEYQAHAAPVTKLAITYDDQFLMSVSKDGSLLIWRLIDKEGRILKRDKEIIHAEEILITKSDLEEKNQLMLELRTRVVELKGENDYQLRLKDTDYNNQMKRMSQESRQQIEALNIEVQNLKTEKDKIAVTHQDATFEVLEKHAKELHDLEMAYSKKLVFEQQNQQALQLKSEHIQVDYEKQLKKMEEGKVAALEEQTLYYENKMQVKDLVLEQVQEEFRSQVKEFEESKRQIEEDGDREVQDLRTRYERSLREERETNVHMKGDTSVMRKKSSNLQREVEECNLEVTTLKAEQQRQLKVRGALEWDVITLKETITEKDKNIDDKDTCIYELQKKNQVLEKFRSSQEYRIEELKAQIEPHKNGLKEKKLQIQEMEEELVSFHQMTTQQEVEISELKLKLTSTEKERQQETQRVRDAQAKINRFKTELHDCGGLLQEPKKLKERVKSLCDCYIHQSDVAEIVALDEDIQKEFGRQREYLERTIASLKRNMSQDSSQRRAENIKIMRENVLLISEINDLRKELQLLRSQVSNYESQLKYLKRGRKGKNEALKLQAVLSPRASCVGGSSAVLRLNEVEESGHIVQLQRLEIQRLREEIQELQLRSPSTARLPALPHP